MATETSTPAPAPAATCEHLAGCTAEPQIGIETRYGTFLLCETHGRTRIDALNPNRKPGGARVVTL